jgi:LAO/AO transport system kinase
MPPPGDLAAAVARRERAAVARAISLVEDRRGASEPGIIRLLATLRTLAPVPAQRIGVTGPPGVGKSTLVSALTRALRLGGRSVGVLAVDPSSPRSGGALLGDRARIEVDPGDDGVFVRSMASGGDLGGLARAAGAALDVLASAFDVVLVETTGVGQSETDVEHVVDTVCFVAQPASGDVLQFLKAGILEIPDVLVVNKMDLGAVAERAVADLASALAVAAAVGDGSAPPPVVATSAATDAGTDKLVAAADAHFSALEASGALAARRARGAAHWTLRWLERRHGEAAVESLGGRSVVHKRIQQEIHEGKLPLSISRSLGDEYLGHLRR